MNKDSVKEKLWMVGVAILVFGVSLFGLFMFSNEEICYFSALSPYTLGFFITGLIASFCGFLFTIICLDQSEAETKADNTTKIRILLTAVTITYMILIGYLMSINCEWKVQALIIESFNPTFGFYEAFTVSSYGAMFATLLVFGIFVLPFVINESGILDDYPDGQNDDLEDERQTIEDAEKSFNRFVPFLKGRFDTIKKIKKYTLPIGITLTILGSCLVGLPYFLLKDGPLTYDPKTEIWFIKDYKGFIRGQFLLLGLLFFVLGIILIMRGHRHHKSQTNPRNPTTRT